jgi:magnesium-transporting ATPase (P-type)
MGYFDSERFDEDFVENPQEEAHLLKKFNDYVDMEKKFSKQGFLEISDKGDTGKFGKRFIISAMIQGAIITGLTIALFLNQMLMFNGNIENMFEFAFTDKAGIFFFGFVLQMGLTAGLALTGIFYNHIETRDNRKFTKFSNILSWTHLYGANVFGSIITISLIFAGIATSALYQTDFDYLLKSIPSLVYISAICLVVVLGVGILGTATSYIRGNKED